MVTKRFVAFHSAISFITDMLETSVNSWFYEIIRQDLPVKPTWTLKQMLERCRPKRAKLCATLSFENGRDVCINDGLQLRQSVPSA
jgi:hypothetical protein